ncbi:MAG: ubiquinol-cytochrome c reductase iron-sulfur subunit [Actinomycetota bacterium]
MTTALALSTDKIAALVAGGVLVLFMALLSSSFIRTRRGLAAAAMAESGEVPPTAPKEPLFARLRRDRDRKPPPAVTRREFFRRSLVGSMLVFSAEFGGASLAFLWPNLKGGFGSVIAAGKIEDIKAFIQQTSQPFYAGVGRFYIVPYNGSGKDEGTGTDYEADGVISNGLMPLYQRCVHLGCRVPFCQSSQWFECPCHGSKYNKAGEYQLGPAPHGMDRFKITVEADGTVLVDTSTIVLGPPRGTDTIQESPQGPFCVAPG